MMLVIAGLPGHFKYHDTKAMIKQEAHITDFILDNLVADPARSGTKKATVALADNAEAPLLMRRLNGFDILGNKLSVTPVTKKVSIEKPRPDFLDTPVRQQGFNQQTVRYNQQSTDYGQQHASYGQQPAGYGQQSTGYGNEPNTSMTYGQSTMDDYGYNPVHVPSHGVATHLPQQMSFNQVPEPKQIPGRVSQDTGFTHPRYQTDVADSSEYGRYQQSQGANATGQRYGQHVLNPSARPGFSGPTTTAFNPDSFSVQVERFGTGTSKDSLPEVPPPPTFDTGNAGERNHHLSHFDLHQTSSAKPQAFNKQPQNAEPKQVRSLAKISFMGDLLKPPANRDFMGKPSAKLSPLRGRPNKMPSNRMAPSPPRQVFLSKSPTRQGPTGKSVRRSVLRERSPLVQESPPDRPTRHGLLSRSPPGQASSGRSPPRHGPPGRSPTRHGYSPPRHGITGRVPSRRSPPGNVPPRLGHSDRSPPRHGPLGNSPPRLGHSGRSPPRRGPLENAPPRLGNSRRSPPHNGPPGKSQSRFGSSGRSPPRHGLRVNSPPRLVHSGRSPPRHGPPGNSPTRFGHSGKSPPRDGPSPPHQGSRLRSPSHFRPLGHSPPRQGLLGRSPPRRLPGRSPPRQNLLGRSPPRQGLPRRSPPRQSILGRSPPRQGPLRRSPPRQAFLGRSPPREGLLGRSPPRQGILGRSPPRQGLLGRSPPRQAILGRSPPRQGLLGRSPPRQGIIGRSPPRQEILCRSPPRHGHISRSPSRHNALGRSPSRFGPPTMYSPREAVNNSGLQGAPAPLPVPQNEPPENYSRAPYSTQAPATRGFRGDPGQFSEPDIPPAFEQEPPRDYRDHESRRERDERHNRRRSPGPGRNGSPQNRWDRPSSHWASSPHHDIRQGSPPPGWHDECRGRSRSPLHPESRHWQSPPHGMLREDFRAPYDGPLGPNIAKIDPEYLQSEGRFPHHDGSYADNNLAGHGYWHRPDGPREHHDTRGSAEGFPPYERSHSPGYGHPPRHAMEHPISPTLAQHGGENPEPIPHRQFNFNLPPQETGLRNDVANDQAHKMIAYFKPEPQNDDRMQQMILCDLRQKIVDRIDDTLGMIICQSFEEVLARYRARYPESLDDELMERCVKACVLDNRQDNKPREDRGAVEHGRSAKPTPAKRFVEKASRSLNPGPAPGSSAKIPQYPEGDKQVYREKRLLQKLEYLEENPYQLSQFDRQELDSELDYMMTLVQKDVTREPRDSAEATVLEALKGSAGQEIRHILDLHASKRILGVSSNLVIRIFGSPRLPNRQVLEDYLKQFRVVSMKKTNNWSNMQVVTLPSYYEYDYLCKMQTTVIDGMTVQFKPFQLVGPRASVIQRFRSKHAEKAKEPNWEPPIKKPKKAAQAQSRRREATQKADINRKATQKALQKVPQKASQNAPVVKKKLNSWADDNVEDIRFEDLEDY